MDRRDFFRGIVAGGVAFAVSPVVVKAAKSVNLALNRGVEIPSTNIDDALAVPRNEHSMPGKFPGRVVKVNHDNCVVDGEPSQMAAYNMLSQSMLALTGAKNLKKAWLQFVSNKDIIGLKVNPIGGKLLSTSHAVVKSIIKQLEDAGIPRKNIVIWDRREVQLHEAGFTAENYPGIEIIGTEYVDADGSYYDKNGKLYGESRIDKNHYFYADVEEDYDVYTMPHMVNGGKYSYYSTICTQKLTKIINVPVLKNAGASTTLCLKNLAFGSISNTMRLHKNLWHQTSAYACAFAPLRDKVVLNIADGFKGCFEGGPAANPQYICQYNTMLVGSDPVAVDRIGHEIVVKKRFEMGVQTALRDGAYSFATLAEELKLGVASLDKIELIEIKCS